MLFATSVKNLESTAARARRRSRSRPRTRRRLRWSEDARANVTSKFLAEEGPSLAGLPLKMPFSELLLLSRSMVA